jgi:hypothetical protein
VSVADKTQTFSESVAIDIGSPNLTISEQGHRKVMLTVSIGEIRKERLFERVPVIVLNAPPGAQIYPKYVNVLLEGARSAIDEMTAADIEVAADFQMGEPGQRLLTPMITVSPAYADKVNVRAVEPLNLRVR